MVVERRIVMEWERGKGDEGMGMEEKKRRWERRRGEKSMDR